MCGGADGIHHVVVVRHAREVLIEVADAHARSDLHAAGVGPLFAQQAAQEGRLAAAVGAEQAPALAADDLQVDAGKQRPLEGLGQPLGTDDDIAAARGGRKAHGRKDDHPRHGHQLDAIELLAAVFGLLVLLAVVVAADEVLGLFDLDLLPFVSPLRDQQPLGLLRPVGGEVARVAVDGALEQLQGAVGHAVEEVAVVADQEHGRGALGQERFEPLGGLDIEVVGGLIQEHHVRLGQQQLGQHDPILLAAAERLDGLVERFAAETQPVQDALDLVVQVVGVAALHFVLEVVVAIGKALVLQRVVAAAQLFGDGNQLRFHGHEAGQGALGLVQQRAAGLPLGLLLEIADVQRRMADDRAAVGLLLAWQGSSSGWSCRRRWVPPGRSARRGAPRTSPRRGPARGRSASGRLQPGRGSSCRLARCGKHGNELRETRQAKAAKSVCKNKLRELYPGWH